jgi:DNA-binding response OmpR family regulator
MAVMPYNGYMAKIILIIEDDPLIVKIYSTRLKSDGYEVFSAENGEDGLRLVDEKHPDLIILDVMMPRIDGFGVLTKLRSTEATKNTPVLLYSNLAAEEEVVRAKALGATEFIVKANISPTEMVVKIKSYLGDAPASA